MEKYAKHTDDELVALYQDGDYKAFDELLARSQDRVYQYLYFMLNNEDAANDAFQDTFVRAIMALREGRYKQNGQFLPWLLRVARNLVIDRFRGQRTRRTTPLEIEDAQGESTIDVLNTAAYSEPDVEMATVLSESADDVKMMINRLPEEQREVVIMRYYQELSFKEIADLTDVSINTALGRMRYALINLRRMAAHRNLYLAV
ncbi:MAG: sigma-70 family RNA polymerase sigma factor [Bacteroidaceae bacterium]|nr:sigma-70 family RNA polymerase sigma factor [Bacteroidaceae bacterium]